MKNILFIIFTLLLTASGELKAQFEGKRFVSGSAGVSFGNTKPKAGTSTNGYGYNFNIDLGKFKTDTKAVGWRISSNLGGGKTIYSLLNNGSYTDYEKTGISGFGAGLGRFWQFYKHFNEKFGIFGGPDVGLSFSYLKQFTPSENAFLVKSQTKTISLSAGLSAGLYYRFSEKWWVDASLAFSNPISVDYSFLNSSAEQNNPVNFDYSGKQLSYKLSPTFNFPSVGFGLRYFLQ